MAIRIPDDVIAGTWALGVGLSDFADVLTLDFFVRDPNTGPEEYVAVRRIHLAPDSIEPFYTELGAILQRRRDAHGDT